MEVSEMLELIPDRSFGVSDLQRKHGLSYAQAIKIIITLVEKNLIKSIGYGKYLKLDNL